MRMTETAIEYGFANAEALRCDLRCSRHHPIAGSSTISSIDIRANERDRSRHLSRRSQSHLCLRRQSHARNGDRHRQGRLHGQASPSARPSPPCRRNCRCRIHRGRFRSCHAGHADHVGGTPTLGVVGRDCRFSLLRRVAGRRARGETGCDLARSHGAARLSR